jgi:hypothetical protein
MPSFGISSTFGLNPPDGYVQETSETIEVEPKTIRGEDGQIVVAQAARVKTRTVTIRTKGDPDLVDVSVKSLNSLSITSSKVDETNNDFPTAEVTAIEYI